jgi:YYY domain-containing protein
MEYGLVLWWLLAYLAFMAVGMPLAAALFPRLADRGAGVALPTALAVLWVVAYLFGHVSLTAGLLVGLAALAAAAGAALYRANETDGESLFDRRRYAEAAAVFTAAFLFMIAVRAVDAGVHPFLGEKFLDFGMLQSLLRADALPPEDMWFAGRPVQYYYGGHLITALLTKITGTDARFAYNLALAGFYGMLVTAAYGLAGSIAASRGVSRVRAGAFAAFFVGFASNISTPVYFAAWLLPDGIASFFAGLAGTGLGRVGAGGLTDFRYWDASRVIEGTINEFPLFAWLNGDMHAHMMSTPFVLLTAALLFSYYRTPETDLTRRRLLVFAVVPPLAGMLAVVNTWSFPTAGGLTFLALALSPADPVTLLPTSIAERVPRRENWQRELARHGVALGGAVAVVALGLVWSLPFWLGTASGRSIAFFPDRSSLGGLLFAHGAFVLLFAVHLARHSFAEVDSQHVAEAAVMVGIAIGVAWIGGSAAAVGIFGPMIVVAWILLRTQADVVHRATARAAGTARRMATDGGTATGPATGETPPETASGTDRGLTERLRDVVGFETLLIVAGAGIVVLVEFVYVQEQAGPGRMNTVFKTYADVWILWAVAAGAILAHLVENHSPGLSLSGERWASVFRALAVVLIVSTSLYGALALGGHFAGDGYFSRYNHPDDPTLDGFTYINETHPEEYAAIRWFEDIEGQPNIASAPGQDMYRWTNPVSSLTGVPTVAGWAHEVGYRGGESYRARVDDVNTIYTGSPEQRAYYLDVYEVEYVYVGSNERSAYTSDDLAVFDSMAGVTVEKQWDGATVYRVDQGALEYTGKSD